MKINSDLLINSKVNGVIYADNFKFKNLINVNEINSRTNYYGLSVSIDSVNGYLILNGTLTADYLDIYVMNNSINVNAKKYINSHPGYYILSNNLNLPCYFALEGGGYPYQSVYASNNVSSAFVRILKGSSYTNTILKIQLEFGLSITDWVPYNDFSNDNIYSTREIKVGTFLGKPLYRQVFTIASPQTTNTDYIDLSSLKIDNVVHLYGYYTNSTGKFSIPLQDSDSNFSVVFVSGQNKLRGRFANASSITDAKVILEYTKTTD